MKHSFCEDWEFTHHWTEAFGKGLPGNPAVDPHHRLMGGSVKAEEQPGRSLHRRHPEPFAVAADHLVIGGGGIVQRHLPAAPGRLYRLYGGDHRPCGPGG